MGMNLVFVIVVALLSGCNGFIIAAALLSGCVSAEEQQKIKLNDIPKPAVVVVKTQYESKRCETQIRDASGKYHKFYGAEYCFEEGHILR